MDNWKDVVGYEGLYKVSDTGKVRSLERYRDNKNGNQVLIKGRLLKQAENLGYKYVSLSKNGEQKSFRVHRLVAIAFLENKLNKPNVNHKDCNKSNNNVNNLEWCTQKENVWHAFRNGKMEHLAKKNLFYEEENIDYPREQFYRDVHNL